jgi:hypothetical protein
MKSSAAYLCLLQFAGKQYFEQVLVFLRRQRLIFLGRQQETNLDLSAADDATVGFHIPFDFVSGFSRGIHFSRPDDGTFWNKAFVIVFDAVLHQLQRLG